MDSPGAAFTLAPPKARVESAIAAPEACCDDVTALVATYPACALGPEVVRALADHLEQCETCARRVGARAEAGWAGAPARAAERAAERAC